MRNESLILNSSDVLYHHLHQDFRVDSAVHGASTFELVI